MLEACLDLGFPVSVLGRSPSVLRDLGLLKEINQRPPSVQGPTSLLDKNRFRLHNASVRYA